MQTQAIRALVDQAGGLVTRTTLAKRWGVSRQRAHDITMKPTFPEPFESVAIGHDVLLWLDQDVREWEKDHRG